MSRRLKGAGPGASDTGLSREDAHFVLAKDGSNTSIAKTQSNANAEQIKLDHLLMRDCGGIWARPLENKTMEVNKHATEIACTIELLRSLVFMSANSRTGANTA